MHIRCSSYKEGPGIFRDANFSTEGEGEIKSATGYKIKTGHACLSAFHREIFLQIIYIYKDEITIKLEKRYHEFLRDSVSQKKNTKSNNLRSLELVAMNAS